MDVRDSILSISLAASLETSTADRERERRRELFTMYCMSKGMRLCLLRFMNMNKFKMIVRDKQKWRNTSKFRVRKFALVYKNNQKEENRTT